MNKMINKNQYKNNTDKVSDGESDDGFLKISLVNQGVFVREKKLCPLKNIDESMINYKNLKLLNKFISERGKIIPSRITNVSMKKQKILSQAIKRARNLALLSPIARENNQN